MLYAAILNDVDEPDDAQNQKGSIESNNLDIKTSNQSLYNKKNKINNKMIKKDNYYNPASKTAPISWHNALAIIPPDDAWDQIQRARYVANDSTYKLWPPTIRIFHHDH